MKLYLNNTRYLCVFILLFLVSMNFYTRFPQLAIITLAITFVLQKKLIINKTAIIYMVLGLLMLLYKHNDGILAIIWCFAPVAMYLVGYNIISVSSQHQTINEKHIENKGYMLLFVAAGGAFVHYLLNFSANYTSVIGRNTTDIWTGSIMAATGQAALACLMLGMAIAFIIAPPIKILRYVGVVFLVLIIGYNFILACRTILVILLIVLAVATIFVIKNNFSSNERLKLTGLLSVIIILLVFIFGLNIGGITNMLASSNLFERVDLSFESITLIGDRGNSKIQFLLNGYKYPLGGLHLREHYGYAHDLLLDGYDEYGILGFALLLSILILGIKDACRIVKNSFYSKELRLAVLCIYIAVLLEFFVEPILSGMSWLFACYCLINGCLRGLNVACIRKGMRENENLTD